MADREPHLADLMRLGVRGDKSAYRQVLYELAPVLRGMVKAVVSKMGAGTEEVEDIVQETLLALHLKRHTWDDRQPLLPWVRAIARNKLIDTLRRRGRRVHIPIEDISNTLAVDAEAHASSSLDVAQALAHLKGRQQEIVRAISLQGETAKQVADRLGMTESAVRVALHRALRSLAKAHSP